MIREEEDVQANHDDREENGVIWLLTKSDHR